ncbi:allantoin transporter [Serratia oryzae]|uniref:Allantoin permease n=1 Tax=Serratia oryzae TaxID=2034155 RepID=A0A1S8CM30_9GAMM|nr:putative allantoin permease [Serratia oryzae]OMQ23814.1 allantoin permease [Serratia oryzae]VXD08653.1 allantoin or uracil transporter [Enterobacterales bacterium 8AC]
MAHRQEQQLTIFKDRGYSDDLLPKGKKQRNWRAFNYFALWMGAIHNVPNYIAVGGFLMLGLSTVSVMMAISFSAFFIAFVMIMNGAAGSKYGIPGVMLLRACYGVRGALVPGVLRGCIAAIMWFGLQNYAASLALLILIGKVWPGFLHIGNGTVWLGISIPGLISFLIFWLFNTLIGFGGGETLKKFTTILNPCVYIVFGSMAVWAASLAGIDNIIHYVPQHVEQSGSSLFLFFVIINAILGVWAAPAITAADFTQNAVSFKQQAMGQAASYFVGYTLFAILSVIILVGATIHYGVNTWNVMDIIQKWDSTFATLFAGLIILMTTISINAACNLIPAGYQIAALAPQYLNYKSGIVIASIVSVITCPWKLMENQDSIYFFLDLIGGMLGPVVGVMLAHYFIVMRGKIDLNTLYSKRGEFGEYKNGINAKAFYATLIAIVISLGSKFIPYFETLSRLSWFVGVISSFMVYLLMQSRKKDLISE